MYVIKCIHHICMYIISLYVYYKKSKVKYVNTLYVGNCMQKFENTHLGGRGRFNVEVSYI